MKGVKYAKTFAFKAQFFVCEIFVLANFFNFNSFNNNSSLYRRPSECRVTQKYFIKHEEPFQRENL